MIEGMICEIAADAGNLESIARFRAECEESGRRYAILRDVRFARRVFSSDCARKSLRLYLPKTPAQLAMDAESRRKKRRHFELNPHLRTTEASQ